MIQISQRWVGYVQITEVHNIVSKQDPSHITHENCIYIELVYQIIFRVRSLKLFLSAMYTSSRTAKKKLGAYTAW